MTAQQTIHIVTLNIPYPANYGGMIDMYHKARALHNLNINVILHCFEYNRPKTDELLKVCSEVHYYQRKTGIVSCLSTLPYNVFSRRDKQLLDDLLHDDYPILFEGLHSTYIINHPLLKNRIKILRPCNVEHEYYAELGKVETNIFKKLFFFMESAKLKLYEPRAIKYTDLIVAVSKQDEQHFINCYPGKKSLFIPCFHEHDEIAINEGVLSDYILYHGNLSVSENSHAASWLVSNVFSKLRHKCIVAGMEPSNRLRKLISKYPNIILVSNPSQEEMSNLVKNAQINILVTFQGSGLKLKLLNSLFSGRHIIVNHTMTTGTELHKACHIADSPSEMISACNELMNTIFSEEDKRIRTSQLFPQFSNIEQAKILTSSIF